MTPLTTTDLQALLPFLILGGTPVLVMVSVALRRSHALAFGLTVGGLLLAFGSLFAVRSLLPRKATTLMTLDGYGSYFTGLIVLAGLAVAFFSYDYLRKRAMVREEFYILLLLATLGAAVLTVSSHFASFFLGLEVLSVALYPLIAYDRGSALGVEAGLKYLILAAAAASFLVFGMALVYAQSGTMELSGLTDRLAAAGSGNPVVLAGLAMIIVGIGFKLGVVPFHMWTPDVFQGAPPPVAGLLASISKGAMFALLLRFLGAVDLQAHQPLFLSFVILSVASMLAGNLLALFQRRVKRLLAYSSVAHLGYLLVAFLAAGPLRTTAVAFYLTAYFITTLGGFGVVTVLSGSRQDGDTLEEYQGLFWRRPWLGLTFTAMLLSLAGLPLTAGFMGKFLLVAAGAGASLWLPVLMLLITSGLGLFYYLRVVAVIFQRLPDPDPFPAEVPSPALPSRFTLALLLLLLLWLGIYPAPLLQLIRTMTAFG